MLGEIGLLAPSNKDIYFEIIIGCDIGDSKRVRHAEGGFQGICKVASEKDLSKARLVFQVFLIDRAALHCFGKRRPYVHVPISQLGVPQKAWA